MDDAKTVIRLKDDLLLAEKNEELYVLDIGSGRVHTFNATAKVIFQLCLEARTLEAITAEYRRYFPVPEEDAREDVTLITKTMARHGLLRPAADNGNAP